MNESPYCKYCASKEVVADGPCTWNEERQEWELTGSVYDGGICQTCGEENNYYNWE